MKRNIRWLAVVLGAAALATAEETRWKYAGESQGIAFQIQITNQCKDNSRVVVKVKSSLDHPVTVSFRLNDSDWRKTFTQDLKKSKEAQVAFSPEESMVCHPYVDQIYVESEEAMVTQTEETPE